MKDFSRKGASMKTTPESSEIFSSPKQGSNDPRETGENFTLAPLDSVDLRIVN
jgi:hypothetical protein